jgi:glycosyltransferase involved in cell wall biosynthesis
MSPVAPRGGEHGHQPDGQRAIRDTKRELRVGFVNENLTAGHRTCHRQLIEEISRRDDIIGDVFDLPGILTSPVPLPPGWDFDLPLFRNQIGQSLVSRAAVRRFLLQNDVIHVFSQNATPLNLDLLRRRPYVVTTDGSCRQTSQMFSFRYPGRGRALGLAAAQAVERRLLRHAGAVIALSEWARRSLVEDTGVAGDRVHMLRLGSPRQMPWVERPDRDVVRVLFTGSSMGRKGGQSLLEMLAPRLVTGCELHLVTTDRVEPRPGVVVHRHVRSGDGHIGELLRSVDVFAFPSDMDMSPTVVFEAMAAGLPVVSYRTGAIPEMVIHGRTGLIVNQGDVRGFRSCLDSLLESAPLRRRLGRAGWERLGATFDPSQATERLVGIMAELALRHRHPTTMLGGGQALQSSGWPSEVISN